MGDAMSKGKNPVSRRIQFRLKMNSDLMEFLKLQNNKSAVIKLALQNLMEEEGMVRIDNNPETSKSKAKAKKQKTEAPKEVYVHDQKTDESEEESVEPAIDVMKREEAREEEKEEPKPKEPTRKKIAGADFFEENWR